MDTHPTGTAVTTEEWKWEAEDPLGQVALDSVKWTSTKRLSAASEWKDQLTTLNQGDD